MTIERRAPAKINLTLDVLDRRPDGYHEIASVLVPLALSDEIRLEVGTRAAGPAAGSSDAAGIELQVRDATRARDRADLPPLPEDEQNLAYRAARLALEARAAHPPESVTGQPGASRAVIRIHLNKHIPQAAGLGGGSSDAAAVLRGVNDLLGLDLNATELHSLAAQLGSDVPFFLLDSAALATGRGEILRPLPARRLDLVLAKLPLPKSTGAVYARLREFPPARRSDADLVMRSLAAGDVEGVARGLGNALETVMHALHPEIAHLQRRLGAAGAVGTLMSGAGPTVFALARDAAHAAALADVARAATPAVWVTHTVPS